MSANASRPTTVARPVVAALLPIMAAVFVAFLVTGLAMPVLPLHVHDGLGLGTFVVGLKLWPGKSEQQKVRLAEEIVKDVTKVLNYGEESVSVAIEEVEPQDWAEKVYQPDIVNNSEKLYKKPGYTM